MKSLGLEFNDGCRVLSDGPVQEEKEEANGRAFTLAGSRRETWAFIVVFFLLI